MIVFMLSISDVDVMPESANTSILMILRQKLLWVLYC